MESKTHHLGMSVLPAGGHRAGVFTETLVQKLNMMAVTGKYPSPLYRSQPRRVNCCSLMKTGAGYGDHFGGWVKAEAGLLHKMSRYHQAKQIRTG